jgi:hypothetical protein
MRGEPVLNLMIPFGAEDGQPTTTQLHFFWNASERSHEFKKSLLELFEKLDTNQLCD